MLGGMRYKMIKLIIKIIHNVLLFVTYTICAWILALFLLIPFVNAVIYSNYVKAHKVYITLLNEKSAKDGALTAASRRPGKRHNKKASPEKQIDEFYKRYKK